jgi:L-methionine (R)-S-oxide reductase
MSTSFLITGNTKEEKYESLLRQVAELVQGESDFIANVATIIAALKQGMGFFWVGIYLVKHNMLVLGPFQGPVACTRIAYGKGVCGTAWKAKSSIVVEDVTNFPGHISCNSNSRSEIVVPCIKHGEVFAVLDVDSDRLNEFDDSDKQGLEKIGRIISQLAD